MKYNPNLLLEKEAAEYIFLARHVPRRPSQTDEKDYRVKNSYQARRKIADSLGSVGFHVDALKTFKPDAHGDTLLVYFPREWIKDPKLKDYFSDSGWKEVPYTGNSHGNGTSATANVLKNLKSILNE